MGGRISRPGGLLLAAVAGTLGTLIVTAPALAHNPLTGSDPKDGARLAKAPSTVRLTFLSRLDPATTTVTVTGPAGAGAVAGGHTIAGNKITVPVRPSAAGVYTIAWQLVASDGDKVGGRIRFTLTVPAAPPPAPSAAPSTAPPTSAPAVAAPATPSGRAEPVSARSGTRWGGWLLLGVLTLVAATLGALLISRRTNRRPL